MTEPSAENRRLAAVMCLDMVGYSALMSRNEAAALACVKSLEEVLRAEVAAAGGRIVKLMGDGSLAEFPNAASAVSCARRILERIASLNASYSAQRFEVRIGLHLGDLVDKGGDIFGEAVNIAARVQPLADPGGIAMTGIVHSQVKNQAPLEGLFLPPQRLKNIPEKATVFLIPPQGTFRLLWRLRRGGVPAAWGLAALAAAVLVLGWGRVHTGAPRPSAPVAPMPSKTRPAVRLPIPKAPDVPQPIPAKPAPPQTEPETVLEVRTENIRDIGGEIGVAVFSQKTGYPVHIENAYEAQWQSVQSGQTMATFVFDSLPPGDYAVSVMHDENGNRKLERSAVGFPKEGVGFSNGQRVVMSAPKFHKASFALPAGERKTITITLDYRHRPGSRSP